ncbi:PREDICTED: LOW QUALITY PROTEIN: trefoil factor 2 [Elephantulus edwardii]|uniref:LOW QUALITY PROTEIN: trefoil factor 2 n=1 Tax=Elephantulus edwardii TaxID=28737 RepID=UPI0003F0D365|nr:PREDICTED: LOW QUALITY PROTEIN: trefoil factor 2 [Elephantulus edwardii]
MAYALLGVILCGPYSAQGRAAAGRGCTPQHGTPRLWAPSGSLPPGAVALAASDKPTACQCSRLNPQNRKNCGFPGITSDQCFDMGCCFDSSVAGVPWCFNPLPMQVSEQCVMEVSARNNCGYPGISPEDCASRKCCFSDTIPGVPWCFFPLPVNEAQLQAPFHKKPVLSSSSEVDLSSPMSTL